MKKILSMLLVLCMALTLCSAAFAEGKSPVDGMTVAFIPKVSGNSFFEAANDGAQKYAKEWGLTVDYIGAPTADVTTQLELIQLSRAIHDADPGYNVPFFTVGMEYMRRQLHERGIDADRHAGPVTGLEP